VNQVTFRREHRIRFSECDPAGIVFYPQYFVLMNDLLETWVDDGLGIGFADLVMQRRVGLPTVRLEVDFKAVSRMGDLVEISLAVENISNRSFVLAWRCHGTDGELRMSMRQTLVTTSLETYRSIPIPVDLRQAIENRGETLL
jgi:4-hydroxybenzoyl-CoA thioesterase